MGLSKLKPHRESGSSNTVNFVNLVLRCLQFLIGVVVIILYATQPSYAGWRNALKFSLGIAAGALAAATTPFLAFIPFFWGYKIVALACIWDFIVMVVYAATFAYFEHRFPYGEKGDYYKQVYHDQDKISNGRIDTMRAAVTVDLVGMLLWLITFLMAIGLLVFGRLRGREARRY